MSILSIIIIAFIILESLNVLLLYFTPDSKKGNGVGVFDAWEESKQYEDIHALIRYLVYWVAGTKLIFIALLIVSLITGDRTTQIAVTIALILSILSYFWRLHPIIKRMDKKGKITPAGYGKTLSIMITVFVAVFTIGLIISLVFGL